MTERLEAPDPTHFRALRTGDVYVVSHGTRLARVFPAGGLHPVRWDEFRTFGPVPNGRFDHHVASDPDRAIWYGALSETAGGRKADALLGAIAETYGDTHVIDRSVSGRSAVLCQADGPLRLLRLDSSWLSAARGNAAIYADDRAMAQQWARAIYDHYPDLDGLYFPSSNHPPSACVAVWERAPSLTAPGLLRRLDHPGLLPHLTTISDELGWPIV